MGSFFKACLKFTKKVMINIPLNKTLNLIAQKQLVIHCHTPSPILNHVKFKTCKWVVQEEFSKVRLINQHNVYLS